MKKVKRLYEEFQPEHYDLTLHPDRDSKSFSGSVKIKGRKTGRPSQRITLHQKGLKISSAKVIKHDKKSGVIELPVARVNLQKSFDELRLHFNEQIYPGMYTLEIEFSGRITEPMHGIYPCNFEIDGQKKQLIATQFESHHARETFPCIDEPEAKATFDLTLKTPTAETVIANTPIKKQATRNKQQETSFETTPKMSTYLLAFAYGELDYKSAKTKNGVEVRVYATPDKVKLTDFAVDVAVRCLEFFENYYGVPYPLPKLDLIGLPDFSSGAMENWGLVTFRESVLYVDPSSSSVETKQFVAMVICHELAHQWFGNLVTMRWWNDLWLNESLADLMEYIAVDALFPEWNIWQEFTRREIGSALSRDSLPNVQAVQTEVNHPDELASLFDPQIVYAKGGSLLNMVRWLVSEDKFKSGLKSYFEEFKYQNTVADDLWDHLEKASGVRVGDLMRNWLQRPGFPVISVDFKPAGKELSVSQKRLVQGENPQTETVWQVPLATSSPLSKAILKSKEATFALTKKSDYPLTLNHDGQSYFVAQYQNTAHFESILQAVKNGLLSPIDRLLLLQNQLLLEKTGQISTLQNIQLLPYYDGEREEAVWGMLAGIIGNARALIDKDQDLESKLNGFIRPLAAPLVKELGWKTTSNEPAQTQKLRALALSLAAAAEDKAVIKEGLKLFRGFKVPADLAPDIRSVVYFIGIRYGQDADFEKLLELYKRLHNADEKDEAAAELTSTRDPKKIDRLLSMITGPDVRLQDAPTWYAWLARNRYGTDAAWQWLHDNWSWVEENYGDDKSYDRFPRYSAMVFSKPDQLKQYRFFFEPRSNIALERPIKLGIEEIEGRIKWRQANEKPVKDWLDSLV